MMGQEFRDKRHLLDYVCELEQQNIALGRDKESLEDHLVATKLAADQLAKEAVDIAGTVLKYEALLKKAEGMIEARDIKICTLREQLASLRKVPWYGVKDPEGVTDEAIID